jgi:hypothetical protein
MSSLTSSDPIAAAYYAARAAFHQVAVPDGWTEEAGVVRTVAIWRLCGGVSERGGQAADSPRFAMICCDGRERVRFGLLWKPC